MIVAALLFTLLECSRYLMLGMMASIHSQSVTESMFAEYNVPAYSNYHLLMMDSGYGTGQMLLSKVNARMQQLGQENLNPSIRGFGRHQNFLQMDVAGSNVVQYELATDYNGGALLRQVSEVVKGEFASDVIGQAYKKVTDIQESCEQGEKADKFLDGALDTIEQAKEAAKDSAMELGPKEDGGAGLGMMQEGGKQHRLFTHTGQPGEGTGLQPGFPDADSSGEAENPMEDVKSAKASPILMQILSKQDKISSKQIVKADSIENRELNTGNYIGHGTGSITDKMLIIQYLKKYTSHYRNYVDVPHALAYEQEYILFGKYSDEDNLEKMAARLLMLREGINFAYLLTDSAKCEEALALATAIAVATGIPGAVKAIQMGILASWAYSESITELRTLFSGGKTASVKTADNWTVSLPEVPVVLIDTSIKSKESEGGISYEDYIQAFLTLESMKKIGVRFANLLEKNIRLSAGYGQIKLDCMLTAMETENMYQAKQVFLSFVPIGRLSKKGYRFQENYVFSYTEIKDME